MPIFKLNDKEPILPDDERYWVAPDANIIGDVKMKVNSSVWFSATLRGDCEEIIIGENSFGKGSVQSIIPLKNRGAIRLTVAKYYLPSGKSISEVGVRPDIEVNEEGDDFRIKTDTDNQLNYAIKLLNG